MQTNESSLQATVAYLMKVPYQLLSPFSQKNTFNIIRRPRGRDAIAALANTFNGESTAEFVVAEGDLVFGHMRYNLPGPETIVVVDVVRFENGLMTQHWDTVQPEVPANEPVSGNSLFSGD